VRQLHEAPRRSRARTKTYGWSAFVWVEARLCGHRCVATGAAGPKTRRDIGGNQQDHRRQHEQHRDVTQPNGRCPQLWVQAGLPPHLAIASNDQDQRECGDEGEDEQVDPNRQPMTMYREMGMTYWLAQVEAEPRQLG
jgi:hypothetical protein